MPFPANPSVGDTYVENNNTYKYLGPTNGWYRTEVRPSNDTTYIGSDGAPGGSSGDTQVIFNNAGSLAGDAGLTYNSTTDRLTAGAFIPTSSTAPTNGVYLSGTNTVGISTGGTGRLFVDASGNVGVNDSSPNTNAIGVGGPTVVLRGTSGAQPSRSGGLCFISQDGNSKTLAYHDANIFYLQSIAATAQVFLTSNAERARIRADGLFEVKGAGTAGSSPAFSVNGSAPANSFVLGSTGRVGIGTTSPSVSLHLDGTIANAPKLRVSRGAGNTNYIEFGTNGGDSTITANGVTGTAGALVFYRDSNTGTATESARIDSSGRLLVGTSTLPTPATDYRCVIGQNGAEGGALYLSRNLSNSQILSAGYSIGAITAGTTDGIMGKILFQSNGTGSASSSPGAIIVQVTESGNTSPTTLLQILSDRTFSLSNTCNFALGTTTGTKIGTATTQKLGFYNATPVVQPAAVADATDAASVITQLNALLARMRSLGLIAT